MMIAVPDIHHSCSRDDAFAQAFISSKNCEWQCQNIGVRTHADSHSALACLTSTGELVLTLGVSRGAT